jgi:serine/threonine-protein kinase
VSPGQVIGERYRIDASIGEGGMGIVCRATHLGLETPVAIKLIRPDYKDDLEFVRRFLNEARRAAALKSDRIARVHDVGQLDSGEPYLVMEYLEGIELEQYLLLHGPLAPIDAVNVVLQICEGLAEAHACGIVHRDIKPSNAFLVRRVDGRFSVKILDFGISKQLIDGSTSITNKDQSLGSPQYMSPEQMLDPSSVDHRSDIWSVGVVLFELLCGKRPFDGTTMPEVCAKVLTAPTPDPRAERRDLDPELEGIVLCCLAKNPDDRFPDVLTLGHVLQRWACIHALEAHVIESTPFFDGAPPGRVDDFGSLAPVAEMHEEVVFSRNDRRAEIARWCGALALAATVAFAAIAFGRSSLAAGAPPTSDILHLPWQTTLAVGPAPSPLEPATASYPLLFAVHTAQAEREHDAVAASPGEVPPPTSTLAVTATESAPSGLSSAQINRRIDAYKRWLAVQGLMRLDGVNDEPDFMRGGADTGEQK